MEWPILGVVLSDSSGLASTPLFTIRAAKGDDATHASANIAWLTTVVVAHDYRHLGIGRQLVAESEAWARRHGAERVSLTSGQRREDAHAFYIAAGYEHTGIRLTKKLI